MNKKFFFINYIHHSILFLAALVFSYSLDMSMPDDGLRHISFAYNNDVMKSWGDVFPYSLFTTTYDPWFMWHNLLEFFSSFIDYNYIHIFINTISLYLLMVLIAYHLKKEIKYKFSSLLYIFVFSIAYLSSYRYLMVRPDLLSGLFVMAALLINRSFIWAFIFTIIYAPFYYLFFMYTGSIGLIYLIQKKWRPFWGVFLGSIFSLAFFLIHNFSEYLETIKNLLTDQDLRMGLMVSEGAPMFEFLGHFNYFVLLVIFLIVYIIVIYKKYEYFKKDSIALFLLITSILWINQARYYYLFLPLIYIYVLSIILNCNKKRVFFYYRKISIFLIKNINYAKKSFIFSIIAIPYAVYMFSFAFSSNSINENIEEAQFFKDDFFKNKTVLLNRLHVDVYKGLYYNPEIKFVPSCSVGWFTQENENIKKIYIDMQKSKGISEKDLYKLIKYVKADIYIHYLNNEKQVLDFDKLSKFGIKAEKIYHNRIIFIIERSENE